MLGAILAAVATLIVSAGLARRRPQLYDARVSEGKVLVGVEAHDAGDAAAVERALNVDGGVEVKTIA
jgi:hypothetical protein